MIQGADGEASQDELRLLEMLRHRLEIERLVAAAIERGAQARRPTQGLYDESRKTAAPVPGAGEAVHGRQPDGDEVEQRADVLGLCAIAAGCAKLRMQSRSTWALFSAIVSKTNSLFAAAQSAR